MIVQLGINKNVIIRVCFRPLTLKFIIQKFQVNGEEEYN